MKKSKLISLILFFVSLTFLKNISAINIINPSEMLAYIKTILPDSPVIFEAGGHYGEDTIKMKTLWPNATMHVFEPFPNSFSRMLETIKSHKNIFCYPYALTDYEGKTTFYIGQDTGSSSIHLPHERFPHQFGYKIEVPCTTIDLWAEKNKINDIDFMWLDLEGHELCALQNATKILKSVKAIYTEINLVPIRVGSCLYQDLKSFIESQGFVEVCMFESAKGIQGDALFINKNLFN